VADAGVRSLGIPLPPLEPSAGEVDPSEIELRVNGRRIARTEVYPARRRILKRHWSDVTCHSPRPTHSRLTMMRWLKSSGGSTRVLARIGWDGPSLTADEAAQSG
jgi:hypothetical protein